LASGELPPVEIPRSVAILLGLGGFYHRHIQMVEESEMFPQVERSFAPDDQVVRRGNEGVKVDQE
jgi:hypothetical protein